VLRATIFGLLLALLSTTVSAQDIRYISDKQFIPVRSGAGNDYRITNRGIPSGTRLTVSQTSPDGEWAQITTDGGTQGWVRAQYLMTDMPAAIALRAAEAKLTSLTDSNQALQAELAALKSEQVELLNNASSTDSSLRTVSEELAQLKQISGNAVQLDTDNRRLVEETENLRAKVDMLDAENSRLNDNLSSEAFMDGAFAVLLGVIITLVVPRLWPKRRKSSSWA
jgi:SH3 domain protein